MAPDQVDPRGIDEASGTIVMGANVARLHRRHRPGNLTIRITETPQVSQPNALSGGQPWSRRAPSRGGDQANRRMGVLPGAVTLDQLVRGLNSLGVGPRDLIAILQAIKAAGALQAELEIR